MKQQPSYIYLHRAAPNKPALGQACTGCGLCCALEPCPIGMLLSRQRRGVCRYLTWQNSQQRYVCGLLQQPPSRSARHAYFQRLRASIIRRWIAAGKGCDASVEIDFTSPQENIARDLIG